MEIIGSQKIWTFLEGGGSAVQASNTAIRSGSGYFLPSYVDFAQKIAELQFLNRDYVLLFRGQCNDYRDGSGLTTLKSRIFRSVSGTPGKVPADRVLKRRYKKLSVAEKKLLTRYEADELLGADRLARQRLLRWSILQHYEVCGTPLLDVTHSPRIAASFASDGAQNEAYIFVLGVPAISGAITASSEAGLQIVRLLSACPPSAMRPHFQEGYLLGEYPELYEFSQKRHYKHSEMDFGRRLVAKFRIDPRPDHFWKSPNFPFVPTKALYPTGGRDPLGDTMAQLRAELAHMEE